MNNIFETYRNNTLFKLLCAGIAFYIFYLLAPFLFPLMLAVALAFLLYPLTKLVRIIPFGRKQFQIPPVISILIAFTVFCAFLFLINEIILMPFFHEINHFLKMLPDYMAKVNSDNYEWLVLDQKTRSSLPSNVLSLLDGLLAWAVSYILEMMKSLVRSTFQMATVFIGLVVVPFLAFYFLKDWEELRNMLLDIFPVPAQPKVEVILEELGLVLSSYVRGMVKLCLFVGVCVTSGLYFLGISYPLILGFFAMLAELVPLVGPIVVSVTTAFLAYETSPYLALKIIVFYFVFYQLDANFFMPKIMGSSINLHPVLIIVSILIGAKLFGIIGLIFAVPTAAVFKVLYKHLWHYKPVTDSAHQKE